MIRVATIAGLAAMLAAPAVAADGPSLFKRCAACHLPNGAGIPGAYPPLQADFRALSAKPGGRRYLILAVVKGLAGPITVDGKTFRGVMPAQGGMDDLAVATVLNHVATGIANAGKGFKPFTPAEVAAVRAAGKSLTPSAVAALHDGEARR